jgi:cobalt/nickel transport system permease protein
LFAPYPLSVAIPAMLIGHLTIAGMAEMVVTGGVVAYLQRSDPALLKLTAPGAADANDALQSVNQRGGWRTARPLLIGLAVLMVLSPLGLLAAGTAWGEWAPGELPPGAHGSGTPVGLERLSSFWTAPIPDYAPPFMHSESFGYILSAVFGTGLIILAFLLISWIASLLRGTRDPEPTSHPGAGTA